MEALIITGIVLGSLLAALVALYLLGALVIIIVTLLGR